MSSDERRAYFEKLGEAIEGAAEHLPDGYVIEISIEKDSGVVELYGDEGEVVGFPSNFETLADTIDDAVEFAIEDERAIEKERSDGK